MEIRYVVFREHHTDGTTKCIAASLDYDILQQGKDFAEAVEHLQVAVKMEHEIHGGLGSLQPAKAILHGAFHFEPTTKDKPHD